MTRKQWQDGKGELEQLTIWTSVKCTEVLLLYSNNVYEGGVDEVKVL
jgi:hypothetical protein